jgi:hypothetical protein
LETLSVTDLLLFITGANAATLAKPTGGAAGEGKPASTTNTKAVNMTAAIPDDKVVDVESKTEKTKKTTRGLQVHWLNCAKEWEN